MTLVARFGIVLFPLLFSPILSPNYFDLNVLDGRQLGDEVQAYRAGQRDEYEGAASCRYESSPLSL